MLSKYQEKQKKRICKTESGRIAYTIFEHREEIFHQCSGEELGIKTSDGIEIDGSERLMTLDIWKKVPEKGFRFWYKVLPRFECGNIDKMIEILEAQDWIYF